MVWGIALPLTRLESTTHKRLSLELLVLAAIAILFYFVFIVTIVHKLEQAMISTLVSHETGELVTELALDPDIKLPEHGPIIAFLLSRQETHPIPKYFYDLDGGVHNEITVGDRTLAIAIIDLHNDRLFISFDVTEFYRYQWLLIFFLIISGAVAVTFLLIAAMWLIKKYLSPVSRLAQEVASLDPVERNIRIEREYKDYEVGLIAEAFDKYMNRLDEFVQREQAFTAAVSHELRTPVAVIATSLDLMKLKGIPDKQKDVFNRIRVSTNYMQQVIDSLMFFARHLHDTADKSIQVIELGPVCENVFEQYKTLANDKSLNLTVVKKHDVYARVMENHIEIVLGNLVRNAINNTDKGRITLTLDVDTIVVEDTGYGMEPGQIKAITRHSINPSTDESGGLGLYLITNICRYYDLRLDVDSTLGDGTRFIIQFPEIDNDFFPNEYVA